MATYVKSEAQDWAWENLRGEWSTLMTPFTPDDEVDDDALRHNIRTSSRSAPAGAGCTGAWVSSGASPARSDSTYTTPSPTSRRDSGSSRSRHPHLR